MYLPGKTWEKIRREAWEWYRYSVNVWNSQFFLKKQRIFLSTYQSLREFIVFYWLLRTDLHLFPYSLTSRRMAREELWQVSWLLRSHIFIYFNSQYKLLSFLVDNLLGGYCLHLTFLLVSLYHVLIWTFPAIRVSNYCKS